jgi:hypothetical protein
MTALWPPRTTMPARGSNRGVTETTKSFYGEIDFHTDASPILIRGDAGVR